MKVKLSLDRWDKQSFLFWSVVATPKEATDSKNTAKVCSISKKGQKTCVWSMFYFQQRDTTSQEKIRKMEISMKGFISSSPMCSHQAKQPSTWLGSH